MTLPIKEHICLVALKTDFFIYEICICIVIYENSLNKFFFLFSGKKVSIMCFSIRRSENFYDRVNKIVKIIKTIVLPRIQLFKHQHRWQIVVSLIHLVIFMLTSSKSTQGIVFGMYVIGSKRSKISMKEKKNEMIE